MENFKFHREFHQSLLSDVVKVKDARWLVGQIINQPL